MVGLRHGVAGMDLVEVEYTDALTGESFVRPFDPTSLVRDGEVLERLAARYEAHAAEMRRLSP